MTVRRILASLLALLLATQLAFGASVRHTPTQGNLLGDDGVTYENDVDTEVSKLWAVGQEWAIVTSSSGAPNAITVTSDTGTVGAALAIGRPKALWIIPAGTNSSSVTITVDGLGPYAVVDKDGNALVPNALIAGRLTELLFDGTSFRVPISNGGSGTPASSNAVDNGRLTLLTGVCTPSSNVLAATVVYWTICGAGNQIALYDGISSWISVASPEKSILLTATQTGTTSTGTKIITGLSDTSQLIPGMKASGTGIGVGAVIGTVDSATQVTLSVNSTGSASVSITFKVPASTVLDVYGYLNSGALKLEFAAWTNGTTRATALTTAQDGIYTKTGFPTRRYLGTVATTAVDGQSEFSYGSNGAGGVASNLLVCNQYNRKLLHANVSDTSAPYAYSNTSVIRPVNASTLMRVTYVACQPEDGVSAAYQDAVSFTAGTDNLVGVGLDITNNYTDVVGVTVLGSIQSLAGKYVGLPGVGLHFLQAVELGSGTFHEIGAAGNALTADLMM